MKLLRSIVPAVAVAGALVAVGPAAGAPAPGCATQHSPLRIQVGDVLSQTFTPVGDTVQGFEAKLFLRRAFQGRITAAIGLHVPTEAAITDVGLRPIELARAHGRVSGAANTAHWVAFRLEEPLAVPRAHGEPRLEVELHPGGSDPAWAWVRCASSYAGGRAYGRADISIGGVTVPNETITFPLSTDLQFRVTG